jgi:tetratricopeptide (TPR) repeat protein
VGKEPTSNAVLEDFPAELQGQAAAALETERLSVEKGIDAWKKIVAAAPSAWEPRRELARVYRRAERWKACVEVLKEAVEKASWPAPEAKVPVLLDMVELYRDRLKLDVMVVEAYNRILALQPNNIEVMDALAAQYEVIPRWPELIAVLRKKAAMVDSAAEKIALHLRVANLYLEKFSNQAEAIKAFEAILDIDPGNAEALTFLKQMYEKRRDWDRLVAVLRQEIARVADPAERGRRWALRA